jgi:CRISPR-associated protein Csm3
MNSKLVFNIKTCSNLFIGGTPIPFEIGGIDQRTAVDEEGYPYIPGSSLKGALRNIVREDESVQGKQIKKYYKDYIGRIKEEDFPNIKKILEKEYKDGVIKKTELDSKKTEIVKRYEVAMENASAQYLFGIEGFNNTPKLLFSDFILCKKESERKSYFSIDMKNSIVVGGNSPVSNPRSYQTAKRGLQFQGQVQLYKISKLGDGIEELVSQYIINNMLKFNEGIHRLGNSKSRGYGKIEVQLAKEGDC